MARSLCAAAVGFGWSDDAGTIMVVEYRWTPRQLSAGGGIDGDTVYVSASDGPFTRVALCTGPGSGSTFTRCDNGLAEWFPGNVDTGHLDAARGRVVIGFGEDVHL